MWVQIASLCDRLKVLPKPGGLLDQDETHIRKLNIVLNELDKHEIEQMNKPTTPPQGKGQ